MRIILLGLTIIMLSGCNTFEGMGKDISNAGEAITGSAEKTREKMR